jgi:hypothetical protein
VQLEISTLENVIIVQMSLGNLLKTILHSRKDHKLVNKSSLMIEISRRAISESNFSEGRFVSA